MEGYTACLAVHKTDKTIFRGATYKSKASMKNAMRNAAENIDDYDLYQINLGALVDLLKVVNKNGVRVVTQDQYEEYMELRVKEGVSHLKSRFTT